MSSFYCYFFSWSCKSRFASEVTCCHVIFYCLTRDTEDSYAKCEKSSTGQWTMPTRLTLKKDSGALGYLFYAYWATSFSFFLFKDVEKKMELKSPETPHPREYGAHALTPDPKNAGISILPAPTSPNHVAEAGTQVSSP